jgi:hypothetical protein
MLSKDPSARPEARGVIAALGSTSESPTAVLVLPTQPAARTKWWAAVAGVAAVVGLGVALTSSGVKGSAPSPQRPPQQSSVVTTPAPGPASASPAPTKAPVVIPAARVAAPTTAAVPPKKHRKGHH